jgi:hypothetical protein
MVIYSASMEMESMKFDKFGWNGFYFEIPEDMRFKRHGGDALSGNLGIEGKNYIIEAKWEPIPKKSKSLNIVGSDFVDQTKKRLKKTKKYSVKILRRDDAYIYGHKAHYMVIKEKTEERIYFWYCNESNRLSILRFLFKIKNEDSTKIMKRTLETFICHTKDSNIWSLLNMYFETPKSFLLSKSEIKVGRAYMILKDRKLKSFTENSSIILVEYFSMANIVYKESYKDLDKWFNEHLKELNKKLNVRRLNFKAGKSIRIKRHKSFIKNTVITSGITSRKTSYYSNATWYCTGTNRIYSITVLSSVSRPILFKREINEANHKKLFKEFLSSLKCHN